MSLAEEIERSLLKDETEAKQHSDEFPNKIVTDACLRLVVNLTPYLEAAASLPRFRWAAFAGGGSEVELVVHGGASKRQVNFEVTGNDVVGVYRIDENMKSSEEQVGIDDSQRLAQLIAWVSGADLP